MPGFQTEIVESILAIATMLQQASPPSLSELLSLYNLGLIRLEVIVLLWPDNVAANFHVDLEINGAVCIPPHFPAVVEMNYPSEDQESLLNIDIL